MKTKKAHRRTAYRDIRKGQLDRGECSGCRKKTKLRKWKDKWLCFDCRQKEGL